MILAELKGGLGNQMFQYTAARTLAERHATELALDLGWYRVAADRAFGLSAYGIRTGSLLGSWKATLRRRLGQLESVREQGFGFDPAFLSFPDNVRIEGYWQSRRYVELAGAAVHHWFALPKPTQRSLLASCPAVVEAGAVSVHVRRGDYVSCPVAARLHGICQPAYYEAACRHIARRVPNPRFLVFSDDPTWVAEEFRPGFDFEVVSGNPERTEVEEHFLMSRCKHHIIANSSYSWWAAWLGAEADGTVVAPRRWFASQYIDIDDLLPERWMRL